jgi:hypothetical protein
MNEAMITAMGSILGVLVLVSIALVILAFLREIICWYFKFNRILEILETLEYRSRE